MQQSLRNLDTGYSNFFRNIKKKTAKAGFPKFKKKNGYASIKNISNTHIDFNLNKIKLPIIGKIKFYKDSREIDLSKVKINSITISRIPCGKYFASVLVNDYESLPNTLPVNDINKVLGLDLGLSHYIIDNNGNKVDNPKYYQKNILKLKQLQKRLSKKLKSSNRYKKLKLKIAKLHYRINNLKKDFIHKLTKELLSKNQGIILEDLNVTGMMQNHKLAGAIGSASWGEFVRILKYKAEWQGKQVVQIGRFEPSTKICSNCNEINNKLTLGDRVWRCNTCNVEHDRDVNAARNIRKKGMGNILMTEEIETMVCIGDTVKIEELTLC